MYLDAKGAPTRDSIEGWRSSGVPGTVRGFEIAVSKYGKRTWAENMAPAVELASKGFPVSYPLAEGLEGIEEPRELAGVEAHLPEERRVLRRRRNAGAAGAGADARSGSRRTARASSTRARPRSGSPPRWRSTAASSRSTISRTTRRSSARRCPAPTTATRSSRRRRRAPAASRLLEMLGILDGTGYEKGGAGSASSIHYLAEVDAPGLRRPQRVHRRSGLREGADRRAARSGVSREAARDDRSRARHAERSGPARQAHGHRADGNDALLRRRLRRATPSRSPTRSTAATATASPCRASASC